MAQQHSLPHAYPMSPECEFANPSKVYDQNFGEDGKREVILGPATTRIDLGDPMFGKEELLDQFGFIFLEEALLSILCQPRINKQLERGISEVTLNEHKFQVFLDVCQFTPDEIAVRTMDNLLEVTAQHPQKVDRHGFISREFTRTYILPLDVDPFSVKATVTHDGILSIEVGGRGRH
ncbi:hypothetical protein E2320_007203 [Naja naja]|nr:hypothetical protein E2320_007203 [Naja naja]